MPRRFFEYSDEILKRIDKYCQDTYDDGHRTHLGASIIGDKCLAKLWFTFRWVYHHKHTGRMQRLFNTGHKEEARIIEWLIGAGYDVQVTDFETSKQAKISDINGHFGGSIDGTILISGLGLCLLECKTNKTGSDFKGFFEGGFQENKPKHWSQTCTYGYKLGIKYVVYICKNKDNDDLFIQVEELDWEEGKRSIEKAKEVIIAKTRPYRIAQSPAYFECKNCNFSNICHKVGVKAEKNCRSCKHAVAILDESLPVEWGCTLYNNVIPKDFIPKGCDSWESIV